MDRHVQLLRERFSLNWIDCLYFMFHTLVSYFYMIKWNWPDFQGLAGVLSVLISILFLSHVIFLTNILLYFVSASVLKFDDIEKRRMHETISFKEVYEEIVKLKVASILFDLLACNCCGFSSGLSRSCSMTRS